MPKVLPAHQVSVVIKDDGINSGYLVIRALGPEIDDEGNIKKDAKVIDEVYVETTMDALEQLTSHINKVVETHKQKLREKRGTQQ
jgi:hypothetical protein